MNRRTFLAAAGVSVSTTGCLQLTETNSKTGTPTPTEAATSTATDSPTETASPTEEPTDASTPTLDELACPADRSLSGANTDDWRQPQSDAAGTGYVPGESVGTASACIAWRQENLGPVSNAVILSDSHVFTGGKGGKGLRATNRVTGELVWTTQETLPGMYNVLNPLVVDGTVYVTGEIGAEGTYVFALDAETGVEKWRVVPTENIKQMDALRYKDEVLYGASSVDSDTVAWAIDTAKQRTRWEKRLSGRGIASCAVANGSIYLGGDERAAAGVQALDADSGEVLWRAVDGEVAAAPTPTADKVYATTADSPDEPTLIALNSETGEPEWTYETLNGTDGSPVVADGTVTFGTSDGELYCLDTDGSEIWSYRGKGSRFNHSSPIRVGDVLLVGGSMNESGLFAIDAASGELQWSVPTPDVPMTAAAVDGDIYTMYRTQDDWTYHLMALRTA